MKKRVFDIFIWIATLGLIAGILFLPDKVPLHWNASWEIDRYGSRYEFLIITLLPIISYYGILFAKKIDPKRKMFQAREKTYEFLRKGLSLFLIVLCGFFYYMAFNPSANGMILLCFILGFMFVLVGNYMPKLPQNFFMGIRTPWAICNEEVWRKTQKMGGYSFVLSGIVLLIWGVFDLPYMIWVILIVAVTSTIAACSYSYIVYKKIESE